MGRMDGKVVFVTGAGRGQGRSHAIRLAEEGADIIAVDICAEDVPSVGYGLATADDLEETVRLVEKLDRRIVARQADVRDLAKVQAAVDAGIAEFGRLDVVCANAGIVNFAKAWEIDDAQWNEMLDVNLKGVWHTLKATIPFLIEQGTGGSLVLTSSLSGMRGFANTAHYTAAKHGVVGLMRTLVNELSEHRIRVNTVHPTQVDTQMLQNQQSYDLFLVGLKPEERNREAMAAACLPLSAIPEPWVEPVDISNAVLFLASDEARYVTGQQLKVDLGFTERV